MVEPRAVRGAPKTDIEELLAGLRRELSARDEAPGGLWIEGLARDLVDGSKPGVYFPPATGGGIAFYTRRGPLAFGHLHVGEGAAPRERGTALARALLGSLAAPVEAIDLGFTGLAEEDERAVVGELALRDGSTVIERQMMERALGPSDRSFVAEPPPGVERLPVRDVTLEALADLDLRGFAGSHDALLIGTERDDYARSIAAMLDDQMGRLLDEASCALVEREPTRLVGTLLTAERSARRGVFLDLVVDPERRGRGLGRFLLEWGLRALGALGYERVGLWVSLENRAALALYEAAGFRPAGHARIYRWERASSSAQPQRER